VPAGQAVAYNITVNNVGDTNQQPFDPTNDDLPAANPQLLMAIPAHTGFQTLTFPPGWSCAPPPVGASGQVACTTASLAVNAPAQFVLTVAVNDCSTANGAAISATAKVTSATANPNPVPANIASTTIQVTNTAPVITANGPLNVSAECATSYTDAGATATDACQGAVPVSSSSNVNISAVGTYAVNYSAVDAAGLQAAPVTRTVQVVDTTAPVVTLVGASPIRVECATGFTDPGATAVDSCVGALPVSVSGSVNPNVVGSYTLAYSATDPSGNTGAAARAVNVADSTAPQLTVIATSPVLQPPDHRYVTFAVSGGLATAASDTCDATVGLGSVVITQVTSDEPDNGNGDGNTVNDIVIAGDCRSVQLRAERAGPLNGRVYKVTLKVTDASGNSTTQVVKVFVPHDTTDLTGSTVVDDGAMNTVTSSCH
jgi:hypothetical protein